MIHRRHSQTGGWLLFATCVIAAVAGFPSAASAQNPADAETTAQRDARMAWFREARFGLFIHWGLYAVPAGKWGEKTGHGEWIRDTAQIPIPEYEKFVGQFNPTRFNAEEWAAIAKDAGMRYVVITSKHHDGFCLFDSAQTDFDVMSTPFKRDILKELSAAVGKAGLKMCWYHSIMDWHHPDYVPRRPWERQMRPEGDANFDRYVDYMKSELKELLTNYGPIGILWFDGQWEGTWNNERGRDLEAFVRKLQPDIVINSRVGKGGGAYGIDREQGGSGDYGTPEQFIPDTGISGLDWETCMTMNGHWGYNAVDQDWKSSRDLIHMLIDIASKGGNFLLNVGPTAEGRFPQPCIDRLHDMGAWLKINGDAIYGTSASPLAALPWGRCTMRKLADGDTRLYLHVFTPPADGKIRLSGLLNAPKSAHLLADSARTCAVSRDEDAVVVSCGKELPDPTATVIVLDIAGSPDVAVPPTIAADFDVFVDSLDVRVTSKQDRVELRYTLDGSEPNASSPAVSGPIKITESRTVKARSFRDGKPISAAASAAFQKVSVRPPVADPPGRPGLAYQYYEGNWDKLPDFASLKPAASGDSPDISIKLAKRDDQWALVFEGYIEAPRDGVYRLLLTSDDGSRLWIGSDLIIDHDGLHSALEKPGLIALAAGRHPIRIAMFEKSGGADLSLSWEGPGIKRERVPAKAFSHR
ncbi:MAG: alpha-L-fucosidase [Planctomycetes bacterium]|nr:alpha-L-fucosidase [Planctomycetota bacterium]